MAEESTQSIVIEAEPDAIMAVIADFSSYPQWAGPVKDEYVLSYTWTSNGLAVDWQLVRGQMQRSQRGSYVLRPTGSTTQVTCTLAVELVIPMIGMFKRKAER